MARGPEQAQEKEQEQAWALALLRSARSRVSGPLLWCLRAWGRVLVQELEKRQHPQPSALCHQRQLPQPCPAQ